MGIAAVEHIAAPARGSCTAYDPGCTLHELLRRAASHAGSAVAVSAPGCSPMTYMRLWQQVEEARAVFSRSGLGESTVIATSLTGGPVAAVSFLALASIAAVAPLNPTLTEPELGAALGRLHPAMLVVDERAPRQALGAARALGVSVVELAAAEDDVAGGFVVTDATSVSSTLDGASWAGRDDTALLLSTSGTSGPAKTVALTHRNVIAAAGATSFAHGLGPRDVRLNVMPLFHVQGLVGAVVAAVVSGGSVVCAPYFKAGEIPEWMDRHGATWFSGSPTMYREILKADQDGARVRPRTLRFLRVGSAALTRPLREQIEERFDVPVVESYGMTEAHQIASTAIPPALQKAGSVGQPTGCDVLIVDAEGITSGREEPGEILIRGPNVAAGFTGDGPGGEWFCTGDIGVLDSEGYLAILGRTKEMINRGGEKVSPYEVEEALSAHPAVVEVAAFGIAHADYGEDVAVAVVSDSAVPVSHRELRLFLADRLAPFKRPAKFFFVAEIPRGSTGKIERRRLADRFGGNMNEGQAIGKSEASPAKATATETALLAIWKSVLEVEDITVEDDFFVIGGDSLKGMQLLSEVASAFSVEIPPLSMYDETSTAATMASFIDRQRAAA